MRLASGSRLGPYEIESAIGAGGMGEVYKARDTRLDRRVAVKVLSADISASPDARKRFEREARTISQLSHPHICALYDVGHQDGIDFLVMELVDGETLADRLAKGALPAEQTIKYAVQIADALDKAHRCGIVHRDLKPANVMITKAGVKLLDFGLAKAQPVAAATVETVGVLTTPGAVAGTVPYMAPEQLEGRSVDHRTDIWAFGAVVYEMATAERLFRSAPRTLTPPALDRIVRVAVAANPEDRWQSARDIVLQLDALAGEPGTPRVQRARSGATAWTVAAIAVVLALVSVARRGAAPPPAPRSPIRFEVLPPAGHTFWDNLETVPLAIAPDASRFGFIATDGRLQRVWLRSMTGLDATPVNGTEGARSFFWSPDGKSIGFFASGKLKRIDLPGGAPITLCDVQDGIGHDGTWGDGEILFAPVYGTAIYRVATAGGAPAVERSPDQARREGRVQFPWFLPDGRRFLYSVRTADDGGRVMLAERGQPGRVVLAGVTNAQFAKPDVLVYAREGVLLAQRLDVRRGELVGAPMPIADQVRQFYSTTVARFGVSRSGSVIFHSHVDGERLAWIDRSGADVGTLAGGLFITLRISPDARRVAFARAQPGIGTFDLWIADTARGLEQRLTADPGSEVNPVWHPDGATIFFAGGPGQQHVWRRSLATGEQSPWPGGSGYPEDISRDGKELLVTERLTNFDLWTLKLDRPGERSPLVRTAFAEYQARISPDGRFFAFTSNESGRNEIYISSYPPQGLRTPVSTGGGTVPRWSRDGRELFFLSSDRRLMAVPVRTSPTLAIGAPVALFSLPGRRIWKDYDVAADGRRFLAIVTDVLGDEQPLTAVVNAFSELGRGVQP